MRFGRLAFIAIALLVCGPAYSEPAVVPEFRSITDDFDRFEANTHEMPETERTTLFRQTFSNLFPGFYEPRGRGDYDQRIARALTEFPKLRATYRQVERDFPAQFKQAITSFRRAFPDFSQSMPIWFVHSLGELDGGTRKINGNDVFIFGADKIALLDVDRMQPFLHHEIYHLENAKYFTDCDPLWCDLWREGLAVYAASQLDPNSTDYQLLLTTPAPIREAVDRRWGDALCLTAAKLDSVERRDQHAFFYLDGLPPDLPKRFGYYVGLRIMQRAGMNQSLAELTRLDKAAARLVLNRTLSEMIAEADAPCGTAT